jgi:hypothetical protein
MPLPLDARKAFVVGQVVVGSVALGSQQGVPPMGRSSEAAGASPKVVMMPSGSTTSATLNPLDPLGFGGAATEARLPTEEPIARSSHPHDRGDEGSVQDAVESRRLREFLGEGSLQEVQLGRKGSDAPIELALRAQHREVGAQVRPCKAPEVALAAKARPLGEDG